MKHTTLLYTCVGLMGAAAIAGFTEFKLASRKGELKNLYTEQPGSGNEVKQINIDDYSRGPIEPPAVQAPAPPAKHAKPSRPKRVAAPPQSAEVTAPSVPEPAPAAAMETPETPPTVIADTTTSEITIESVPAFFSRAPLPQKKKNKRTPR